MRSIVFFLIYFTYKRFCKNIILLYVPFHPRMNEFRDYKKVGRRTLIEDFLVLYGGCSFECIDSYLRGPMGVRSINCKSDCQHPVIRIVNVLVYRKEAKMVNPT